MDATKKRQISELIMHIKDNCPGNIPMTKLWKLCFFAESEYFDKYSDRLTNVQYIKNILGPTPDWKVAKKAIADNEKIESYKWLDENKKQVIENVCMRFGNLSTSQLVTLSYQDPVYLMAEKNEVVNFENVFYKDFEEDFEEYYEFCDSCEKNIKLTKKQREGLFSLVDCS